MRYIYLIICLVLLSQNSFGQYQVGLIPRVSPDKEVYQKMGYTDIDINYGSPKVNDRKIWGSLVAYNEVWRAGANEATTIEFSEDVYIEGNFLAKGKYSFFVIPKKNSSWTVIFNKMFKQWGAYNYDSNEDALRFEVEIQGTPFSEELSYDISNLGLNFGTISLNWENIKLEFNVETDYLNILSNRIDDKLTKVPENIKWVVYIQAAEFLLNQNSELTLSLDWLNIAENLYPKSGEWHHQYYPKSYILGHLYWTKASVLAELGRYNEAIEYVTKLKNVEGEMNFYTTENKFGELDDFIVEWERLKKS